MLGRCDIIGVLIVIDACKGEFREGGLLLSLMALPEWHRTNIGVFRDGGFSLCGRGRHGLFLKTVDGKR